MTIPIDDELTAFAKFSSMEGLANAKAGDDERLKKFAEKELKRDVRQKTIEILMTRDAADEEIDNQSKIEEKSETGIKNKFREIGRGVYSLERRTIRMDHKIKHDNKPYKGADHRVLSKDNLKELGFDIPVDDKDYKFYFNEKGEMRISRGFLRVLEQGIFVKNEAHHLFYKDEKGEWETSKISIADFVNKYYVGKNINEGKVNDGTKRIVSHKTEGKNETLDDLEREYEELENNFFGRSLTKEEVEFHHKETNRLLKKIYEIKKLLPKPTLKEISNKIEKAEDYYDLANVFEQYMDHMLDQEWSMVRIRKDSISLEDTKILMKGLAKLYDKYDCKLMQNRPKVIIFGENNNDDDDDSVGSVSYDEESGKTVLKIGESRGAKLNRTLKWWSDFDDINEKLNVVTHEFAHLAFITQISGFKEFRTSVMRIYEEYLNELKYEKTNEMGQALEDFDIKRFRKLKIEQYKKDPEFISEYGHKNVNEFFAECVQEYINKPGSSKKYVKKIGSLFDEHFLKK